VGAVELLVANQRKEGNRQALCSKGRWFKSSHPDPYSPRHFVTRLLLYTDEMTISSRGFIIPLLLIIVVLLVGGSAYVYMRKPQSSPPTSNSQATPAVVVPDGWQTYTDEQHGFSLSFPPYFKKYEQESGVYCDYAPSAPLDIGNCFSVGAVDPGTYYDLTEIDVSKPIPNTDYQTVTVNGHTGVSGEACDGEGCSMKNFSFKIQGKPVTISFYGNGNLYNPKTDEISPLAQQILSTFK
jgi:hypothetical protein